MMHDPLIQEVGQAAVQGQNTSLCLRRRLHFVGIVRIIGPPGHGDGSVGPEPAVLDADAEQFAAADAEVEQKPEIR
jgi:hypothetical protein